MAELIIGPESILWWNGNNLSGDIREASFTEGVEPQEITAWGDGTRIFRAGLYTIALEASGYADHGSGTVDEELSGDVGVANSIITIGSKVSAEGDITRTAKGLLAAYSPFGSTIGEMSGFSLSAQGDGNWFRGKLMAPPAARTSSSNSTGLQLGTIAASQNMSAALHVFAVSGTDPTLDVIIQSDDNSGFSAPTTRMTFAEADAVGSEYLGPTAGPGGSDDYWRVAWTIGGTSTPTFNFAVVFGHGRNG